MEIKGPKGEEASHWNYKVVVEARVGGGARSVKWMMEVNGIGSYTFEASMVPVTSGNVWGT